MSLHNCYVDIFQRMKRVSDKIIWNMSPNYRPPETEKSYVCECDVYWYEDWSQNKFPMYEFHILYFQL